MFDVAERVERFIVFVPMTTAVVLCMEQQFCLPTVRDIFFCLSLPSPVPQVRLLFARGQSMNRLGYARAHPKLDI